MQKPMLAVSEIFGPTFQGEGPSLGRQAIFLRLSGCNLKCSWCDTKYTWDWENYDIEEQTTIRSTDDVMLEILQRQSRAELLVITGGEPLLQWRSLEPLIEASLTFDRIEIETNGTVPPRETIAKNGRVFFNVSPKLMNSHNDPSKMQMKTLLAWHPRTLFKFVCESPTDLAEVRAWQHDYGVQSSRIWIMPQGTKTMDILLSGMDLAQEVLDRGWNLTTRQHVLLWGDQRGR